jgi:hypothetical protein
MLCLGFGVGGILGFQVGVFTCSAGFRISFGTYVKPGVVVNEEALGEPGGVNNDDEKVVVALSEGVDVDKGFELLSVAATAGSTTG